MMIPDLQSAIALYKRGEKDEARRRVAAVCKATPDNGDAWYVAAMMAEGEQQTRLLERALAIDPFHDKAAAALGRRGSSVRTDGTRPNASPKKAQTPVVTYGLIAVTALVLVGLIAFGVSRFAGNDSAAQPPLLTLAATLESASPAPLTTESALPSPTTAAIATHLPSPTPAPFETTATAYRYAAQTAQAELHATATSAALTFVPPAS